MFQCLHQPRLHVTYYDADTGPVSWQFVFCNKKIKVRQAVY